MSEPRVLLITGASGGIGEAVARRAVADGWRVALAARRADALTALSDELGGAEVALPVATDVTEWDQVEAMAATVRERMGGIHAVFANAGFGATRGFTEETPEHWRSMILTNVYGAAITIRATFEDLKAAEGHLILTGSIAGKVALPGSVYSSTKWAVAGMAESARRQMTEHGVKVTLLNPGAVDTDFFDSEPDFPVVSASDVAEAVAFALSRPPHVAINEITLRPTLQET